MHLPVILFLCAFCSGPPAPATAAQAPSSQQTAPEAEPADSSALPAQNSSSANPQQSQPAAPSQNPPATVPKKPSPAKRKRPNPTKNTAPCSASAAKQTSPTPSPSTPIDASGAAATGASPAQVPAPCAPAKVVVRNGGTSEGTVQLSGGDSSGHEASRRAGTDQLLASTEDALKKIAAVPLDSGQQDTVKQIRQYIAQARSSLAAGDLDLAHNLAVKAHLLADELLKPRT
jgi:hypothetical protein